MKDPKILILHDYFLYKGGGERLIVTMAKELNADVATAFVSPDAFDPREYGIKTIELMKDNWLSKIPGGRYLKVNWAFTFGTRFIKDYDIVIHSGDTLNALINKRGKKHVAYMHTPPRHLFDSYQDRLATYGLIKKLIFVPYAWVNIFRWKFLSKKFDRILTNSNTVKSRIKKYLNMESTVVYPPCNTVDFRWLGQKDYYLSWARLYPAKRVDQIVEAFTQMPDKKLVVGSSGPELERIKRIAEGYSNIDIRGWISDEELIDLLGNCIASIYIPVREDFGMSPVEAMTAGKPTIGVNEGGLKESIVDGETGILIDSSFGIEDIINAVNKLNADTALQMKDRCIDRAKDFSTDKFIEGIKNNLKEIV